MAPEEIDFMALEQISYTEKRLNSFNKEKLNSNEYQQKLALQPANFIKFTIEELIATYQNIINYNKLWHYSS